MAKVEKDKRIRKEKNKLNKLFKEIPEDKKKMVAGLIERAAFMKATLEDLEEEVNRDGATVLMENGKQIMRIENPAQKSYNTMINRYSSVMKQLNDLHDREINTTTEIGDGFEEFIDS